MADRVADRVWLVQTQVNTLTDAQAEELSTKIWDVTADYCESIGVDWIGSAHIETDDDTPDVDTVV